MKIKTPNILTSLLTKKGAQVVTLHTQTFVVVDKKNCTKNSVVNGIINWSYEGSVNKQRDREGSPTDFRAQERKWGERIPGTPLVRYRDNLYLEIKVEKVLSTEYKDETGNIIVGKISKKPTKQGLQKEVVLRDYLLDSIRAITIDGQTIEFIS
jgi:hypothetical protein